MRARRVHFGRVILQHINFKILKAMEKIGNYTVVSLNQEFGKEIKFWLCENHGGEMFEILTISKDERNDKMIQRIIDNEVKPLKNRVMEGIQTLVETGFDNLNECYYLVYEHLENYKCLLSNIEFAKYLSLKQVLTGLCELKNENRQVFFISPDAIRIDKNGNAKLQFVGLFEIFNKNKCLNIHYLSSNVKEWYHGNENIQYPNFQDDIFSIIKSFEFLFRKKISETTIQILNKALATKRIERFAKYSELLNLIDELVQSEYQSNRQTIKVITKPEDQSKFEPVLADMNQMVWFEVGNELSNGKNQITGRFSTQNWKGCFFVDTGNYIFIPLQHCINQCDDKVIKSKDAFKADFNFSQNYSDFYCVNFFQEKYSERNRLSELVKAKCDLVKQWRILPEKEKEFIEEEAFKVKYVAMEKCKNNANVKFMLADNFTNWQKIKKLKENGVILFIDDIKIGSVLDYKPKEKYLIIKDIICNIDEIPEKGELIEDVHEEISQFKKQVEACTKFEKSDIANPILCNILANPQKSVLPNPYQIKEYEYKKFKNEVCNKNLTNDDTQREAVLEALRQKPLYLIQGPPGTGKTTVIVELIQQIIKQQSDAKILVTSQSNMAVDNVLERIDTINQNDKTAIRFIRLASENTIEKDNLSRQILPHTYENKLKAWICETEVKSKNYLTEKFANQLNNEALIKLYKYYNNLDKQKDWALFTAVINTISGKSYLKKLFENSKNFNDAQKIFDKHLGKDFMKLHSLQSDWMAFLNGATVEDGKDRKKSMLNNGSTELDFLTAMMLKVNVVGATCIHIASSKYSRVNFVFDYVIMDESSKATPAESLVPINMGKNIILIGDHKQLPPVITREDAVKQKVKVELEDNGLDFDKDFGESLFEKLIKEFEKDDEKKRYIKMLDIQYRMPKQIGSLISKYFYDGKLKNPDISVIPDYDKQKSHGLNLKRNTSILFVSTSKKEKPSDNNNKFKRQNECNVQTIKEILTQLNNLYPNNIQKQKFSIGIIAGYRGQVDLLKDSIDLSSYPNFVDIDENGKKNYLIEINSVDKFQGSERDIIIYDVVRSTPAISNIGFLEDYRRINVAFSRAKRMLVIVGDSEFLIKRARLNQNSEFEELKLQQIAIELQQQNLIVNNLNEILL